MYLLYALILVFFNALHPSIDVGDRVIVEVSRGNIVAGEVVQQEGELIVVKDRNGNEVPLDLNKVTRVVPLVAGGEAVTGAIDLSDGRRFYGTILQDEFEEVVLEVEGVKMTFKREQVRRVYVDPPFEVSYELMLNSVTPSNEKQFRFLIEWLLYKDQVELARSHLDESTLDTPTINALRRRVQLKLNASGNAKPEKLDNDPSMSVPSEGKKISRILTHGEVNLIRAFESYSNNPPPVMFSESVRQQLLDAFADDPRIKTGTELRHRVVNGSDRELFQIIRELRAEHFYSEIDEIQEPESLRRFRQDVHDDWLVNRCGTNACHGGIESGFFYLHQQPRNDDRARYANLLTLERLQVNPTWPLLNFNQPEQSLFIQYGLQRNLADNPHPEVDGWKPVPELRRQDEYEAAIAWIQSMRQVPRPTYPIEYRLPRQLPELPTK